MEGWFVISRLIDHQYEYLKVKEKKKDYQERLFKNDNEIEKEIFYGLRISLTRAVDRIYITYENNKHPLIQRLSTLSNI